jgi:hypothetical protein
MRLRALAQVLILKVLEVIITTGRDLLVEAVSSQMADAICGMTGLGLASRKRSQGWCRLRSALHFAAGRSWITEHREKSTSCFKPQHKQERLCCAPK